MPRNSNPAVRKRPGSWTLGCVARCSLAALSLSIVALAAQQSEPSRVLITAPRILDARLGQVVAIGGVLVEGARVAVVYASQAALPADVARVDLPDTTLVPGLCDLHAVAAPTPSADADFFYAMALAYGVTTLRVIDAPAGWAVGQRNRSRSGEVLAPNLWVAGPGLAPPDAPGANVRPVANAAAVRREVGAMAQLGVDFVRADAGAPPELVQAMVGAARVAKVRTSAEPGATTGTELARAGVSLVDRLARLNWTIASERAAAPGQPSSTTDPEEAADAAWERVTEANIAGFASALARTRTALVPLLGANREALSADTLAKDPALANLPRRWREELMRRAHPAGSPQAARGARAAAVRARILTRLAKTGVRLATGVDVGGTGYNVPGAGIHRELSLLVAAGLTPADAIRAATVNAAAILGAEGTIGQVKAGFKADFFAVEGDPLQRVEDLLRIRLIVRGGEVLDRDELLKQARRAGR